MSCAERVPAKGGCCYDEKRPKQRRATCPFCNGRFKTTWIDTEPECAGGPDWHEFIPPHKPKLPKPRHWKGKK